MGPVSKLLIAVDELGVIFLKNSACGVNENVSRHTTNHEFVDECTGRITIRRRCLLPSHTFPHGLPIQATKSQLHDPHLSPKHQFEWEHLSRYSARPVEPCADDFKRYAILFLGSWGVFYLFIFFCYTLHAEPSLLIARAAAANLRPERCGCWK